MSVTDDNRHGIGGNIPPVTPPTEQDLLADLERRYPKIKPRLAEFESALKSFPDQIKDETVAKELQDLLGQMKDERSAWKGQRSEQKKPWDKLAKVVMNFFGTAEETIESWEKTWRPRLDAFMDEKRAAAQRAAEEEARKERERAETARKEAEAADARRAEAERQAAEAAEREERAKREAAEAEQRKRDAEAGAARAAEEAKRVETEKKASEKAERERNADLLKQIRGHMKPATKFHDKMGDAEEGEIEQADVEQLDALVRPGGIIGVLANQVFASTLLSHEELLEIEQVRLALGNMRQVLEERLGAKERKRREKERKAADAEAAKLAAERDAKRRADDEAAEVARKAREEAESAAAKAKEEAAAARKELTAARKDANEAYGDLKDASRDASRADEDAGRVENRAGRMERRVENSTDADFSRTRGDLGTVGSQGRRWTRYIVDEDALRKVCGPLGPFLTADALEGATFHIMRARQSGFTGELVKLPELPGVEFRYERDLTIRT